MAKFVISNVEDFFLRACERYSEAGFEDCIEQLSDVLVKSFYKKAHKNKNGVIFENQDYCFVIGTCIYKGVVGEKSIRQLYQDFSGDIESIRDASLGNYAVLIRKHGNITIFVDKYQVFNLYYSNINGRWVVTNSLSAIACSAGLSKIDEYALLEESMLVGSIGEQTIFSHIKRLQGYQVIRIEENVESLAVFDVPYNRPRRNFEGGRIEDAVNEYVSLIKSSFSVVSGAFGGDIAIHQTGGLDNRTVLSAFLNVGARPRMLYGVGDSILLDTKSEDLEICRIYQNKFDLRLDVLNWADPEIGSEYLWQDLFSRYGFKYAICGGSRGFLESYESGISDYPRFFECGYFLENLRSREFCDAYAGDSISIEDFVTHYLLNGAYGKFNSATGFYKEYDGFRQSLISRFERHAELYNIERDVDGRIPLGRFDELRWIHARRSDSQLVNFLNDFSNSIAIFSIPELHEFPFDLPFEWRQKAQFQLRVINELCSDALDVPIFSHSTPHRFNRETATMDPLLSLRARARGHIERHFPEGLKDFVINGYRRLRSIAGDGGSKELLVQANSTLEPFLRKHAINIDLDRYDGSVVYLMLLAQYCKGVDYIEEACSE